MGQLGLIYTSSFKKDVKKFKNNTLIKQKVYEVVDMLRNKKSLDEKYNNHQLSGKWSEHYDCHIMPDVILIYRIIGNTDLKLVRLGSHSDLF